MGYFILAGATAYLLMLLYDKAERQWNRYEVRRSVRETYKSDINRQKAKKIINAAILLLRNAGYSEEEARKGALKYIKEVTERGLLDEKYTLLIS